MREYIIKHFADEDKAEVLNLYEKYLLAKEKDVVVFGKNFYTPDIWRWFEKNLTTKTFKIECNGLFEDAERRMISFNNIYKTEFPMKLIEIENTSKFCNLTHRDFLGAVLSLGIERTKIGDLIVSNNICYLPVHEDVMKFILENINKINKSSCKVKEIRNDVFIPKIEFKEEIILISSLRIDSIVCKIAHLSRVKAQMLVQQGQILINYSKVKDKSYELKIDDRITIRGIGKFVLGETIGRSKSGKIKIIIKKYT